MPLNGRDPLLCEWVSIFHYLLVTKICLSELSVIDLVVTSFIDRIDRLSEKPWMFVCAGLNSSESRPRIFQIGH